MAKIRPIDDRLATLVDDDEFEDFYRPEPGSNPRANSRVPASRATSRPSSRNASRLQTSAGDFADPIARTRSRRARADMLQDGYDDGPDDAYADEYDHDEEVEAASQRSRRRVAVARKARRTSLLSSKWGRIGIALAILAILGVLASAYMLVRGFFLHDPRFRIDSASSIQVLGNSEISRGELLTVFGSDIGRNIFTVPLAQRRAALQQLPWVQNSTVMRLLPNQLRVSIVERVPVAFVREGSKINLVDATGVILSMSPAMLAARHYSFPVVVGINADDPPETRADRMQIYEKFITELDSVGTSDPSKHVTGPKVSQQLSEVDVSDPEDVRALMPSAGADILVHFGDEDFANRYHVYQQHLPQWRQQYPHLATIDLRYDRQTVLEMAKTASADAANGGDKVDTTPTLATATAKPAASKPIVHAAVKKPSQPSPVAPVKPHPAKATAKASAKAVKTPVYTLPFDNPHTKHE